MTCEVGLGRIQPSRADDDRHGRKAHVCYPRQYQQRRSEMAWFARSLTVLAILVGFLCLPLRATSAQQSAPVTDCSHAKTAVDRALCTTPELRAADARMAHAGIVTETGSGASGVSGRMRSWLRSATVAIASRPRSSITRFGSISASP